MPTIKDCYLAMKRQIEADNKISVGNLTLNDDNGIVTISVTPKIQNIALSFTEAGDTPPVEETPEDTTPPVEEDGTIVTTPSEDGDGIIITWGSDTTTAPPPEEEGAIVLSLDTYNVYRGINNANFSQVASGLSVKEYLDVPLTAGTYDYYIARVVDGVEVSRSQTVSCTI